MIYRLDEDRLSILDDHRDWIDVNQVAQIWVSGFRKARQSGHMICAKWSFWYCCATSTAMCGRGRQDPASQWYHQHNGVIDYTIGQRRGLGISERKDADKADKPLYVVGIDAVTHSVIVGPQSALACCEVYLIWTSWVDARVAPASGYPVSTLLLNISPAMPALLTAGTKNSTNNIVKLLIKLIVLLICYFKVIS